MNESRNSEFFVYHAAPKVFFGELLLPLNELEHSYPEVYREEAEKYVGRESLRKVYIPPLKCEWSDVLMFSFVHPEAIIREYRALEKPTRSPIEWYRIRIEDLDPLKSTVFLYERDFSSDLTLNESEFVPFSPALYPSLSTFREATREHYRSRDRPLSFFRLAHFLFKGAIPRSKLESIYTV